MPAPKKKDQFSPRRDEIFLKPPRPVYLINDQWPDFYAILEVASDADAPTLENAIIESTSQLLAVNFSRGITDRLRLVEKFLADFRLILLNERRRARYDALLQKHRNGDKNALAYAQFIAGEEGENLLTKAKRGAQTLAERVFSTLRDSPYI